MHISGGRVFQADGRVSRKVSGQERGLCEEQHESHMAGSEGSSDRTVGDEARPIEGAGAMGPGGKD